MQVLIATYAGGINIDIKIIVFVITSIFIDLKKIIYIFNPSNFSAVKSSIISVRLISPSKYLAADVPAPNSTAEVMA
jgi:hypothetical protein